MKKLVAKNGTECMACLECVQACSKAYYKEFHQDLACLQIVSEGYSKAKAVTCSQCGKCAEACPDGLIVKSEKSSKCTACGICVKACPAGVLEVVDE